MSKKDNRLRTYIFQGLLLCFVVIIISNIFIDMAVAADSTFVSTIINKFQQKSSTWATQLQKYAQNLFLLLLIVDVALFGIKAALGKNITDIFKDFTMMMLFAGFMYSVILYYPEWSRQIVSGLSDIGLKLGGHSPTDSPFLVGITIIIKLVGKISIWEPLDSVGLIIAAVVIMACFALITAQVVFIQCEAYIAMNAGILLLGLSGSGVTKEYAINMMRYALSVAFKLFVLQLLLGLGLEFIRAFAADELTTFTEIFTLIGCAIVLLALVKSIPDTCAGIINGSHASSGQALSSAVTSVVASGASAGAAAFSGGASLAGAAQLTKMQGLTGMSRVAGMAKQMGSAFSEAQKTRGSSRSIMADRLARAQMEQMTETNEQK